MLTRVFAAKIALTLLFWCVPLLLFPPAHIEWVGFPPQDSYLFLRLLGWSYLALCVGYAFGLRAARDGERAMGPIWTGIVSNGGASVLLIVFGIGGAWSSWGAPAQALMWGSALATGLIALGLVVYGVAGQDAGIVDR